MNKPKVILSTIFLILMMLVSGYVGYSLVDTGTYYLDTPLPLASYYVGKYTNGSYFAINGKNWDNEITSTNATYVLDLVIGNCTDGMKIFIQGGVTYGLTTIYTDTFVEVRTTGVTITEGQVVCFDTTTFTVTLAKADSATTMGLGYVYLNLWNASAPDRTIVLENGYVAISNWAWTPNDVLYVSPLTGGALTPTIPNVITHVVMQVGTAITATIIKFQNLMNPVTIQQGVVQSSDFVINEIDGTYYAWFGENSTLAYSSTNATYVFQQVFNQGGKVTISEGWYNVDVKITVPEVWLDVQGAGNRLTTINATETMDYIFGTEFNETLGFSVTDIHFKGGMSGSLKAKHGVMIWTMQNNTYPLWQQQFRIERCVFTYHNGYGINVTNPNSYDQPTSGVIRDNMIRDGKGGIYFESQDSIIDHNLILALANDTTNDEQAGITLARGSNMVTTNYCGGGFKNGIWIASSWNNIHSNIIDSTRWHGLVLYDAKYNTITNMRISKVSQDINQTFLGVWVASGSDFNILVGFHVGQRNYGGTYMVPSRWLWEIAGSDYNIYTSWVFEGFAQNANYTLDGTGSLFNFTILDCP